jgi:predicted small secreted protein
MKKQFLLVTLLGLSLMALASCSNTADGFGRDMENAGRKIQGK